METRTILNNEATTMVMEPQHWILPEQEKIRVLLVDDHAVVRQGLRMFLQLEPDLFIVGEATNGLEATELSRLLQPDIILMDLMMPIMDGLTAIKRIKTAQPEIEILALTSLMDDQLVLSVLAAGAKGYLLKDTQASELVQCIRAAHRGEAMPSKSPQLEVRMPEILIGELST